MTDTPKNTTKQSKKTSIAPCFIPLSLNSQSGNEHVLYYNANAPLDDIFECAMARLQAVTNLLENLYEFDKAENSGVYAISAVSALLLNDAMTLLQEFHPVANRLKKSE